MSFKTQRQNNVEIISFFDTLNAENVPDFREYIDKIINEDIDLVILDLEKLEEIDSSGVGAMISLLKRMRIKKGDLRIIKLRGAVKKLFELLRIDRGVDIYEDLESAMQH